LAGERHDAIYALSGSAAIRDCVVSEQAIRTRKIMALFVPSVVKAVIAGESQMHRDPEVRCQTRDCRTKGCVVSNQE
jgi:hypothetical protein